MGGPDVWVRGAGRRNGTAARRSTPCCTTPSGPAARPPRPDAGAGSRRPATVPGGGPVAGRRHCPASPVCAMPRTICRWKIAKTTSSGSPPMTTDAIICA